MELEQIVEFTSNIDEVYIYTDASYVANKNVATYAYFIVTSDMMYHFASGKLRSASCPAAAEMASILNALAKTKTLVTCGSIVMPEKVTIYTDSLVAISNLDSFSTRDKFMVYKKYLNKLNKYFSSTKIEFKKVAAHIDETSTSYTIHNQFNNICDQLAKFESRKHLLMQNMSNIPLFSGFINEVNTF